MQLAHHNPRLTKRQVLDCFITAAQRGKPQRARAAESRQLLRLAPARLALTLTRIWIVAGARADVALIPAARDRRVQPAPSRAGPGPSGGRPQALEERARGALVDGGRRARDQRGQRGREFGLVLVAARVDEQHLRRPDSETAALPRQRPGLTGDQIAVQLAWAEPSRCAS